MKERDKIFVEKWVKTREKGKRSYLISVGSIYGILTLVITQLFKLDDNSFSELFLTQLFLVKLVIFLLIGIFGFALILWVLSEKKYRKLTSENEPK